MLRLASLAILVSFALAVPAVAETAQPSAEAAKVKAAKRVTKRPTVHITRNKGYGFLPGYEAPPDNRYPDYRRNARSPYADARFWSWGRTYYGYGSPGFVRGQYNGGSFGPCWTNTPIGRVWNCGS